MGKPKKDSDKVTREALESYLWTSTGWRGSPDVIEAILQRVDVYTELQVNRACMLLTTAHRKELEAATDRAAQVAAAAAIEAAAAPVVERVAVEQLLEQLAEAHIDAASTLTATAKTLNAIDALIQTLRAADGKAKDIALSERIAERRADPAFRERLAGAVEQNSAVLERMAADRKAFPGEWEGAPKLDVVSRGDVQTAKALDARQEDFDAELSQRVDTAVAQGQRARLSKLAPRKFRETVLPDIAEYAEPDSITVVPSETFDQLMEETAPEPNEATREAFQRLEHPDAMVVSHPDIIVEDDDTTPEQFDALLSAGEPVEIVSEPDPIAAMVAEAEADMLADGTGKLCSACKHVRPRTEFYKDKSAPDGLMYSCKGCNAERARARDAAIAARRAEALAAQPEG